MPPVLTFLLIALGSFFLATTGGTVYKVWLKPYLNIRAAIRETRWWQEAQRRREKERLLMAEWKERMALVEKASKTIERGLIETSTNMGVFYRYKSQETRDKARAQIQRLEFSWVILGWDFVVYKVKLPMNTRPHDLLNPEFVDDWRIESGRPDLQVIRTDRFGLFVLVPLHGARDGIPDTFLWRDAMKAMNELLPHKPFAIPMGLAMNRRLVYIDPAADDPHALTAGVTKSGKSVMMNNMICTLLERNPPSRVQFVFIDLKFVELRPYRHLTQYLWRPIVLMAGGVEQVLNELMEEMFRRLRVISSIDVRDIDEYNAKAERPEAHLFVCIDELALVLQTVEGAAQTIGQLASVGRAAGIHMLLFTQRPAANIIDGPIKSNMDTRIAFKASDPAHSQTMLGNHMAVGLEPRGRAILSHQGEFLSIQAPLITTEQVLSVVGRAREREEPPRQLTKIDLLALAIGKRTKTLPELATLAKEADPTLTDPKFLHLVRQLRYVPANTGPVWEWQGGTYIFDDCAVLIPVGQELPRTNPEMEQLEILRDE